MKNKELTSGHRHEVSAAAQDPDAVNVGDSMETQRCSDLADRQINATEALRDPDAVNVGDSRETQRCSDPADRQIKATEALRDPDAVIVGDSRETQRCSDLADRQINAMEALRDPDAVKLRDPDAVNVGDSMEIQRCTLVTDPCTPPIFSSSDDNGDCTLLVPDSQSDSDLSDEFPMLNSLRNPSNTVSGHLSKFDKYARVDVSDDNNGFHRKVKVITTSSTGGLCEDDDSDDGNTGDNEVDDSDDANVGDDEVNDAGHGVKVAVNHNTQVRRKWDKKNICKYCLKPQSKLPRHLQRKHSDESEVAQIMAMPLRSKRRKMFLQKLLNDGNYNHNVEVLRTNTGEIIPSKRPAYSVAHSNFIPCEYCKAMFMRNNLWKHVKTCAFKPDSQTSTADGHHQARGSLLLPFSPDASVGLKRDILSVMHQDDVTTALRLDSLIMKFGSRLHFKHGHLPHRWQYIRDRLRQMGRLLVKMRKLMAVKCLTDCLVPEHFASVVKSVRSISGFDEETHMYTTPSLALKIGHSLKECVRIEINSCTVQGYSAVEKKQKFEQFLSLCDNEWGHEVSSHALRSLHKCKFNKPTVLPLAEDVKALHDYLSAKAEVCMNSLSLEPSVSCWNELCQITLAQVVVFNRRRGGEAQRMLVSEYSESSDRMENANADVTECLSRVEMALCEEFHIVHVEGKRGRKVPVLLTRAAQSQITCLLELRPVISVLSSNKFVFARRNSVEPIRSSDCLRKFSRECGAKNANTLTSTKLRKHIATMSQMLSLREHELDLLATFMGHDIRTHREFYRLPEETLQVAKVSKLLLAMENGQVASLQGRNFDDVDVDVPGAPHHWIY